jgi:hypothetical protein
MATSLNGMPIADPFDFNATLERLGSHRRSANGTLMVDYFQTAPKYSIKLQWRLLTSAERSLIQTELNNCITAPRTLVLPDGRSFSVVLDMNTDVTETIIREPTGYRYGLSVSLLEA